MKTARFSAVLDPAERSNAELEALLKSFILFGGYYKFTVWCVDEIPKNLQLLFASHSQIEFKLTPRLNDGRCPYANKLAMFEPIKEDYLVALDIDTLVLGDVQPYLKGEAILAVPEYRDFIGLSDWKNLFHHFSIEYPSERVLTSCSQAETVPYFNTGVLVVPQALIRHLRTSWEYMLNQILDELGQMENVKEHPRFFDQYAFTLCLFKHKLTYRLLPIEMNFHSNDREFPQQVNADNRKPVIVHHIHNLDKISGKVKEPPQRICRELVHKFNTESRSLT